MGRGLPAGGGGALRPSQSPGHGGGGGSWGAPVGRELQPHQLLRAQPKRIRGGCPPPKGPNLQNGAWGGAASLSPPLYPSLEGSPWTDAALGGRAQPAHPPLKYKPQEGKLRQAGGNVRLGRGTAGGHRHSVISSQCPTAQPLSFCFSPKYQVRGVHDTGSEPSVWAMGSWLSPEPLGYRDVPLSTRDAWEGVPGTQPQPRGRS